MFQLSDTTSKVFAVSEDFVALRVDRVMATELVLPFVNGSLEFQRKFGLISFDDQVRNNATKESGGLLAGAVPEELVAVLRIAPAVRVDIERPAVGVVQAPDNGRVRHADGEKDLVARVDAVGLGPLADAHPALSIEQAGGVAVVKRDGHSLSLRLNAGEFGGSPMPGSKERGRVTPSQAGDRDGSPGVCNEQGPAPKGKACSELRRNTERSAEMTGPAQQVSFDDSTAQVTDCNTDYIFWQPHRDRNMVPLDRVNSINQDALVQLIIWMGNMTVSNAQLQGVLFQT